MCDKVVCERWCVTKTDGVCDKDVCVTKLCVTGGVSKMVGDKAVCERWCVAKLCVKDGVADNGVRQSCV